MTDAVQHLSLILDARSRDALGATTTTTTTTTTRIRNKNKKRERESTQDEGRSCLLRCSDAATQRGSEKSREVPKGPERDRKGPKESERMVRNKGRSVIK
jgi:hypothetical protein